MNKFGEQLLNLWIRVPRFIKRLVPLGLTLYVLVVIMANGATTLLHFNMSLVKPSDLVISFVGASLFIFAWNRSKKEVTK